MSNAKNHLIKVAIKADNLKLACKIALCACIENNNEVYLPNAYAKVSQHVTPHQWAGFLASLTKDGFYSPVDDYFGEIINGDA